jgi:sugar lactone lactonase YvrE
MPMPSPGSPGSGRTSRRLHGIVVPALAVVLIGGGTAAVAAAAQGAAPTVHAAATSSVTTTGALSVSSPSVVKGATVTVSYSTPAATVNADNWVGLYADPGNGPVNQAYVGASTTWQYAPSASGSLSFSTSSLAAGTYIAYYLYDNGYTWLAQPVTFTVTTASPTPSPSASSSTGGLTVNQASVVQGASVTFSYSTTAAKVNADNWVGLYADPGNGPVNQAYVGASTTWQYAPSASGSLSFSTSSLAPGAYIAYYLYDNGYTWLAQPVTFTVTAAPPVTPPGYKTEFGSGTLNSPSGIALDASGDVWVSDTGDNRVVEFSATGTDIGGFTPSGSYALNGPTGITVNAAGDVFVADTGDNRVVEYSSGGTELNVFGTSSGSGELNAPSGVAVNASGQVLVSDTGDNRVVEFTAAGAYSTSFNSKMGSPTGITVDASGDIWVANSGLDDAGPDAVMEYNSSGTWQATLGTGETSVHGGLSDPSDVALDGSGHAFVADPDYGWVEEFTTGGAYQDEFGETQPGLLSSPQSLVVNGAGDVFVTDTGDNQIVEFAPGS